MVQVLKNQSLKDLNTFGFNVVAKELAYCKSVEDFIYFFSGGPISRFIVLGGGSNVLLTSDLDYTVLINQIQGIELIEETSDYVLVKAGAGENWHDLVLYCIENNWAGIENMSLIPGSVGAAPMQNIGAYGVELKDVFYELEALNKQTLEIEKFNNYQCDFGYRYSVFKGPLKNQYVITSVTLKLSKTATVNTKYGAIEQELTAAGIQNPTIRDVSNAVIKIRTEKLPDPKEIGNSGSFFKNPVVHKVLAEILKSEYPEMPMYTVSEEKVKIPAGWLIEKNGFKGATYGNYGVHKNQALVLVNYGGATGKEVYVLSEKIKRSVFERFNIKLEREVNVLP